MGNPATPSNETDRLSYLHRLASINSRGWYTHTKASTRVYPPSDVQGGRARLPAGNRPTNHPYICVLKGIPEYILHMLYCRLISNSMGTDLEQRPRGRQRAREEERDSDARAYSVSHKGWRGAVCHTLCFSLRFRAPVANGMITRRDGKTQP